MLRTSRTEWVGDRAARGMRREDVGPPFPRPPLTARCPRFARPLLQDEDLARQLIELGYRGTGETLKREEFNAKKKAEREKHVHKQTAPKQLASAGKDLAGYPLLQALANREELVRNGKLTVGGRRRIAPASPPADWHRGRASYSCATRTPKARRSAGTLTSRRGGCCAERGPRSVPTRCPPQAEGGGL